MYHTVYKSLDKSNSLFGLKGSYQLYALVGVLCGILISAILSAVIGGLFATLLAVGLGALAYFLVLRLQARFSERERTRWLCSHKLPDAIVVRPWSFAPSSAVNVVFKADGKKQ